MLLLLLSTDRERADAERATNKHSLSYIQRWNATVAQQQEEATQCA